MWGLKLKAFGVAVGVWYAVGIVLYIFEGALKGSAEVLWYLALLGQWVLAFYVASRWYRIRSEEHGQLDAQGSDGNV